MNNYGLLGKTLSHSLSPKIHELIFANSHLDGEYDLYPVQERDVVKIINKIKDGELKGLNVTIPYKCLVMDMLDEISSEAKNIGAVNTITLKGNKLIGYNTDCFGFEKTLELKNINPNGKNVAVLGSGGSSKAIVYVMKKLNAREITIFSRNPEKVETINGVSSKPYNKLNTNHNYDILVNTTPVGMYPNVDNSPIQESLLKNFSAVVDIIYNPTQTKLLKFAKDNSITHANGLYMLVAQAVGAQEIWNDVKLGHDIIEKVFNGIVKGGYIE